MPQGDEETGEVDEPLEHCEDAVVSDQHAAEVLEPGVGALEFPTSSVTTQLRFVFKSAVAGVFSLGDNQLGPTMLESRSESSGVVSLIGNDSAQVGAVASRTNAVDIHSQERDLHESAFGNLHRRKLHSGRNVRAVDHNHTLRTFPAMCSASPVRAPLHPRKQKPSTFRWTLSNGTFRRRLGRRPTMVVT